jgi:hypothetical protein
MTKTLMIISAAIMATAAPAFARGMEGHTSVFSDSVKNNSDAATYTQDVQTQQNAFMATDAPENVALGNTPDGRTVFITSPQSRDITERGPSR